MATSVPPTPGDLEKGLSGSHGVPNSQESEKRYIVNNDAPQSPSSLPPLQEEEEEVEEELDGQEAIERIPTHTSQTPRKSATIFRTLTARSNATLVHPGPPPDGGTKAWTQACMGHLVILNTWGMIASFGAFQAYYTQELGMEPSAVSWIGSMQMLGHFGLGMFSGRLLDIGYYYWSVIPGMLIAALGMFMTSLCHSYYQFFLAQGVLVGIGCGLQFAPSMSLITTYFSRNRSVALAIMASGSATGGLLYPTIVRELLPTIGFPWTVRVMGFIMLVVGSCYCSLLKPRLPPRKSGPLFELSAFREPAYTFYLIGLFLFSFGVFFAFYYISAFAINVLHAPYSTSINLLLLLNGVGLFGRLIPAFIADRFLGPYNMLLPLVLITAVMLYCWAAVDSIPSLYAFAGLYGFFSAGYQGLFPAVLSTLTKDMTKAGTRNGMGLAVVGLSALIGPPIAGALVQKNGGRYFVAQMWGASMMLAGGCVIFIGRVSITGWNFKVRV
ncbi:MFS general substrate transporter [Massarina eburnea CBS 473.64]|uniref:MFS general substrate transporter n=1 Tax=Massarina eburnea CBS 473.64 TaxID=1395130 RepID=A0A6A6SGJ1_9PLEO|nr:MFS general substrate transporter [Massarina eburnea CBS 473.64]